jgi:hypothetical protein
VLDVVVERVVHVSSTDRPMQVQVQVFTVDDGQEKRRPPSTDRRGRQSENFTPDKILVPSWIGTHHPLQKYQYHHFPVPGLSRFHPNFGHEMTGRKLSTMTANISAERCWVRADDGAAVDMVVSCGWRMP